MKLSERLAHSRAYVDNLQKIKMETAKSAVNQYMQTDQWKMAVQQLPNSNMAVEALVQKTVEAITDPRQDFLDVLRAKGFRQAEIRNLVHRLYITYCLTIDSQAENQTFIYEDILPIVAEYCIAHQEVFATIDVESLRDGV